MKPVTGSKAKPSANEVSIQLALDGHSFSVTGLPEKTNRDSTKQTPGGRESQTAGDSTEVSIEVLTPRTLLVPAELFEASAECASALLAAAGMSASADDEIVWSSTNAGVVAVMAVGRNAVATVRERFGGKIGFTTPLLRDMQTQAPGVWMYRAAGLLYIKVYDVQLLFAEVFSAPSHEDVLCIVERLADAFAWGDYALRLAGNEARALRKILKNRFKTAVCE